jgi:hypothetical protein
VKTITFNINGSVSKCKLEKWLQAILWEHEIPDHCHDEKIDVLRFKALINMENSESKHVVQAVQELYDIQVGRQWGTDERVNKLVFIG